MISSEQADKPRSSKTEDVALKDTNLNGDWSNFFLLILMYAMQGLCLGLITAIPILLKSRPDGTYYEQVKPLKDIIKIFEIVDDFTVYLEYAVLYHCIQYILCFVSGSI